MTFLYGRPSRILAIFFFSLFVFSGNVFAGVSDYERDKMDKAVHQPKLILASDVFDGKQFASGIDKAAAHHILNDYVNALNSAVGVWNGLTSTGQSSSEGSAFLAEIQNKQTLSDQMRAAFAVLPDKQSQPERVTAKPQASEDANQAAKQARNDKQNQQVAEERQRMEKNLAQQEEDKANKATQLPVCKEFLASAMKPQHKELMTLLIMQYRGNSVSLNSVEQVNKLADISSEVAAVCKQVDYTLLTATKCYYARSVENDPVNWCEAVKDSKNLIAAMAVNGAKNTVNAVGFSLVQTPQQLIDNDGFLTFEGPVSYTEQLTFSDSKFATQRQRTRELLSAAGVSDGEKVWAEQKDKIDQLRKTVEKTASQWKSPSNKGLDYSGKLANKQIKQMHDDAAIEDVWLTRATWKIHKNGLGVPLRRTKPGYILFKRGSEEYCQLKSYTLTEQYLGGGDYQQAGGVRFGYVRFQTCD